MKRYIFGVLLAFGLLSPLAAMEEEYVDDAHVKKEDTFAEIKQYIKLKPFFLRLAAIFADDEDDSSEEADEDEQAQEMIKAFIDAFKIGEVIITLESGKQVKVKKLFNAKALKKVIKKALSHWMKDKKFTNERIVSFLKALKKSLKFDAVQKELANKEYMDLKKTLNNAIKYYEDRETDDIADFIDLKKIPLFGTIVKDHFYIDRLNAALNSALNGEKFTISVLLDCLDLEKKALERGYKGKDLPDMDGVRALIELYISMLEDDTKAVYDIFTILGDHRRRKKAEANFKKDAPKPKGKKKDDDNSNN